MQEQQPIFRNVRFRADLPIVLEMHVSNKDTPKKAVDVDDQCMFMIECENGAFGSIEATRNAWGRNNYITFEIHGTLGSLYFNYERRDELQVCFASDPDDRRGFRTIYTGPNHPYGNGLWPIPALGIGYTETKIVECYDFFKLLQTIHRQARILKMDMK